MVKSFMNKKSIAVFSKLVIIISFEFICMAIMAFGIQDKTKYAAFGIGFAILLVGFALFLPKNISKIKEIIVFLSLTGLCLFIKAVSANIFQPTPVADYKTFYETALYLTENYHYTVNPLYIALFPHVFGYSEILSLFFKIFGTTTTVAVVLNVVLSVLSMMFLYKIGKSIGGFSMAVICSVLWIVFPSQSLWNSFILSEPLYTTELLGFWCLILKMEEVQEDRKKSILCAVVAGMVLVLFQMSRTVGAIVIVALFITLFMVRISEINKKNALMMLLMIAVFGVGNQLATHHVESRIGTSTGGFSWYHVCVGLEESTGGKWNEQDWNQVLGNVNRFQQEGYEKPAIEAQKEERKLAEQKLKNLSNPIRLIKTKLKTLLGNDSSGIIIHLKYSDVSLKAKTCEKIEFSTNSFYYMLVVLSMLGAILFFKDPKGNIAFSFLYIIGLTMGHMLIEVQERYRYSIVAFFLIAASYTVSQLSSRKNKPTSQGFR